MNPINPFLAWMLGDTCHPAQQMRQTEADKYRDNNSDMLIKIHIRMAVRGMQVTGCNIYK